MINFHSVNFGATPRQNETKIKQNKPNTDTPVAKGYHDSDRKDMCVKLNLPEDSSWLEIVAEIDRINNGGVYTCTTPLSCLDIED